MVYDPAISNVSNSNFRSLQRRYKLKIYNGRVTDGLCLCRSTPEMHGTCIFYLFKDLRLFFQMFYLAAAKQISWPYLQSLPIKPAPGIS